MPLRLVRTAIGALVLASVITSAAYYPFAPDVIASHWNVSGEADGTMSRFWGLALFPIAQIGLAALLLAIPLIDPLKENLAQSRWRYDLFVVILLIYLLALQLLVVAWNAGLQLDFNIVLPLGAGLVFIYIGTMLGHLKRNYLVGVRTPWTLASDEVWARTHRVSGRLFVACGVASMAGALFGSWAWVFIVGPLLGAVVYAVVYSYLAYRRVGGGPPHPAG
jgi:uncharacterized membrane protein